MKVSLATLILLTVSHTDCARAIVEQKIKNSINKQVNLAQLHSKYDDSKIAAAMNEYKLYNMDRQEDKSSTSFDDATKDKKALKDAEDMIEENPAAQEDDVVEKPARRRPSKSAFEQVQEASAMAEGQGSAHPSQDQAAMQTEEDIQSSQKAVSNSVGDKQLRVDLKTNADNLFMGTFYLGTPGKAVNVILDTGSEHLAIASDLCENCPSKPYSLAQSSSKQILSDVTQTVLYGSAKFEGKPTQDKTCLGKDKDCMDFKFLSLSNGEGLDQGSDGILGLSPEMSTDRSDQHLVWSMMQQGLISKAAFSLSLNEQNSFAVFGGIDEEQIVGGASGLKPFRNNPDIFSHIKAWALSGKGLFYGMPQIGQSGTYPAVIDTGSTLIAIPSALFKPLQAKWQEAVKDLDCSTDPNFCEIKTQTCDQIEHSLQPVGFLIGGGKSSTGSETIFEIKPSEYLFQANGKCQIGIAENKLDKFNNKNFIFGQLFLRHFYTVYNFENEQISLGINKLSKDVVKMINPDQRDARVSYAEQPIEDEPKVVQPTEVKEAKPETEAKVEVAEPKEKEPPKELSADEKATFQTQLHQMEPAETKAASAPAQEDGEAKPVKKTEEDFEKRVDDVENAILE